MLSRISGFIDTLAPSTTVQSEWALHRLSMMLVAIIFVVATTLVVSLEVIAPFEQDTSALRVGSVTTADIRAPYTLQYASDVLTAQQRDVAANAVAAIYNPPDPTIARQQVTLLQQIFDFIENIRRDPYGTFEQRSADLRAINALKLREPIIEAILTLDEETWRAIVGEANIVLERVMREPIREADMSTVIEQLPSQVSLRFDAAAAAVVVALVEDIVRPNRFLNIEATEAARASAREAVAPVNRSFERGQVVVRAGVRLEPVDYEALQRFGLLEGADRRGQGVARALVASLLMLVLIALYLSRFSDPAFMRGRFLAVLCAIFVFSLLSARMFAGVQPPYYINPSSSLALLLVVIAKPEIALIGTLAQGVLLGVMANNSLEIATLVIAGGFVGALLLRRTERLNSYFVIGVIIALTNLVVVVLFNLELVTSADTSSLGVLVLYALVNGVLSAMVALVGMYVFTFLLNLPTSLKLVELSQPNQPLLQRLLREAPGTYQHSLQVANLCEQAASKIGANAELVRVAALYHDIGKMGNPAFFVENQADNVNPHDGLDDPYRSASIIIAHVTDGEQLARQYRLPVRIRDFILEHHGTTKVGYFYTLAVKQAGEEDSVDVDQFTYPGPKPQSRETAIMMLADGCESTVRARKPTSKQEIADVVDSIFNQRMRDGQLDESNLTLRDLDMTREIFIEMLQAVFHPRVNYPSASPPRSEQPAVALPSPAAPLNRTGEMAAVPVEVTPRRATVEMKPIAATDDEDQPLRDVPPLRRAKPTSQEDQDERGML